MKRLNWIVLVVLWLAGVSVAQRGFRFGQSADGFYRTAREYESGSTGTPTWTNAPGFENDVFTFTRVVYARDNEGFGGSGRRRGGGGGWRTDLPDSDLNLSWRLQQMTSLKVDPNARLIRVTDPELAKYPFIYIVEPGGLYLDEEEVVALRKYLLNGGFLWLDDFWGEYEWSIMERELRKVFKDRSFEELKLDHSIYHCVFEIKAKHQVPSIRVFEAGATSERGYESREVHHRAIHDDKGRMMVLATHNTDNGDGWEREGENTEYFAQCSEKVAYPLAINVLYYVMTH